MTKLFLSVVSALYLSSTLAQVGINTETPQSALDVNGSIQLRHELRVKGTAGQPGEIYFSRGNINDPQWIGVNIPFVEEGQYQLVNTYAKSDQLGIDFEGYSLCDSPIVNFPFTENFEANSPTRACWTNVRGSGSSIDWTYAAGGNNSQPSADHTSGSGNTLNALFFSANDDTERGMLISPVLDLTNVTNPSLNFWYAQDRWSSTSSVRVNELRVYYRTAQSGAGSTWIQLFQDSQRRSSWTEQTLSLPNKSATYQIAFEGINKRGRGNVVDDVVIGGTTTVTGTVSDPNYYNSSLSALGELINAKNWTRIPGLDIPLTINEDDNKISIVFQTGVESRMNVSAGSQTAGNIRYLCGLFQRETSKPLNTAKLVAVRGDQINTVIGKANSDKAQSIFTLNYTVDNTPAGDYTFSVACRRLSLTGGGGSESTSLLSIGNSITSGTITNDFMLNSILKMDVIELVTVTSF